MSKCEKCKQEIKNKNEIIECPQCMNLFHLRCVKKRNMNLKVFQEEKRGFLLIIIIVQNAVEK